MKISLLQLEVDYETAVAERRAHVATYASEVVTAERTDLLVLPELWPQGGFRSRTWADEAESLDGPTVASVADLARRHAIWVHGGSFVERSDDGALTNTSVLVAPDGSLAATYRKIHLFGFTVGEPELMTAGTDVVVAKTDLGPIGLATCYDLRFPELFRALNDAGAEVVLVPAAWPTPRIEHWRVLVQARAIENQYVVAACNVVGEQGTTALGGRSAIVDARGDVLVEAGDTAQVLTADVDLAQVHAWRRDFPVLADRRL